MSSQTPNINLTLPVGSENVSRQIINDNNTKIDTAFGGTAGRELLGYKENGDTASQAISDGSFVVWKGNLYKANGNISQGATLSVSNLTAVSSGGFNDLQGQVDSLSDSCATKGAPCSFNDIVSFTPITKTATTFNTYNSRKFSDYTLFYVAVRIGNYFRPNMILQRTQLLNPNYSISLTYYSGGEHVEIVVDNITDTSVRMKYNATGTFDINVGIFALTNQ